MARRWLTAPSATPSTADPPLPHLGWDANRAAVRVAIFGNVVVVLLFFAAVIWRLYFSGTTGSAQQQQQGTAGRGDEATASSSGASSPSASPRGAKGLKKGDLVALPVYVHRASASAEEGKAECAVCICELKDGDTGRHLPGCGHQFHAECVDRWFSWHVTCPLCRAVVVGEDGSGDDDPKARPG